jgi:HD-GYP domain-containing protein (c-di-GMP phosphodiesterase class II)
MTASRNWEDLVLAAIAELAAGATTMSLYGSGHPRAVQAVEELAHDLGALFAGQPEVAFVVLAEELFVQGRPFTRLARQAPALIRRLRRRDVGHVTFTAGVAKEELRAFLEHLVSSEDARVKSTPHVQVGRIELSERELGGPDETQGGLQRRKLATVRDRVAVVHECFADFASGRELGVADLERVARAILDGLAHEPDPLRHLAPWDGARRWIAVHAHNVAALTIGVARLVGVSVSDCLDLGLAALLHDIGKLSLPGDVLDKELELAGDQIELMFDHPRIGLEALLQVGQLPDVALVVAFEHHLDYNGTGYPRLRTPRRPHPAARLVAAAETVDVLLTARGRQGMTTRESTVAWLAEHEGTTLDPGWSAAFRQLLERP